MYTRLYVYGSAFPNPLVYVYIYTCVYVCVYRYVYIDIRMELVCPLCSRINPPKGGRSFNQKTVTGSSVNILRAKTLQTIGVIFQRNALIAMAQKAESAKLPQVTA